MNYIADFTGSARIDQIANNLTDLKNAVWVNLSAKKVLLISSSLGSCYLLYRLVKFHLYKRKYRHIPGPPTKG